MLRETKYTHGKISGVFSNDNMAFDYSTPKFHEINKFVYSKSRDSHKSLIEVAT